MLTTLKILKHKARLAIASTVNLIPASSLLIGSPRNTITAKQVSSIVTSGVKYHLILTRQQIEEKPPNTIDEDVFFRFKPLYKRIAPEQFVIEVENGRVWGNNGAIITRDDSLIEDVSREFGPAKFDVSKHFIFKQIKLKRSVHYHGSIAVIASPGTDTYGHWFGDILPRLFLLQKVGLLQKADRILINGSMFSFHKETLKMLGIEESKLLHMNNPSSHITADTLYVSSYPNEHGTVNSWVSTAIRQVFIPESASTILPQNKRIYIGKLKLGGRKITNAKELFSLLEKDYGFVEIVAENYTMQEKINIFNQAECIISPHGSGLMNIVFSRKGTKVVDIFPPGDFDTFIWSLANSAELDFFYFFGEGEIPTPQNDYAERNADIEIDIAKFRKFLSFLKLNN